MKISRREFVMASGAFAASLAVSPKIALAAADLPKLKLGVGLKAMSPIVINLVIGEVLGYNKAEGFSVVAQVLGSNANVQVAVDRGEVDFGVGVPSFGLPVLAQGEWKKSINFYEYTYPYKWDIAVLPKSTINSYKDLKGKRIGVSGFGATDYPVTKNVLQSLGFDPDKDFKWVAVGGGVPAGVALERGQIDALAYYDVGFGLIEAAGLPFRLVPRPPKLPLIGGQFLETQVDRLRKNKAQVIGLGRAVCKSSNFILANPKAGALAFLRMYPEAAPRGSSQEKAVDSIYHAIDRRIKLYSPPYPGAKMGSINVKELQTEAAMNHWNISDYGPFYTNDLIDEINNFDLEKIRRQAKEYS
ncbi:ABC transporter substrate-binding protein [Paralcaligenes sp. KSB-10]|uniref:ABC transporter substrate-binding protein n=1 Tax=Paralcaligenes sp. KSB-10 TaxID=2901142 RepID=UPI001E48315B|nr:ABC transporter substrate-binding protein [Paralcaligenes sp. KSB-10]UHL65739.1 ABC transporter substrate-binding protein [Paralcaligenes sp. KSB-10]